MDKKNLKISIITVCLNSEKTIARCIASVLSQTYFNIEYVVIDGKSIDLTCKIIDAYKQKISIFISEPDSGIYSAWNKGIKLATGDYILMLNSDDTLYDSKVIDRVVDFILINNFPKVVYGKLQAVEDSTGYSFIDGARAKLDDFIYKMKFCTPTAFISRDVYFQVGFYNEKYSISSDYDFAIRLFMKFSVDDLMFFNHLITRFSVGGTSNRRYKLALAEVSAIVKEYFPKSKFIKHLIYKNYILFVKIFIPVLHKTGLMQIWRGLKRSYIS